MIYTVRPISDRTWLRPDRERVRHQFDSKWGSTLELLGKELRHLEARQAVIECDVSEGDIRNDGMLRASARPTTPAVVVAFESKHGAMLYRSDKYAHSWSDYPGWQANVRAVALTLNALRAVDRYGATDTGQQYAGFKALPAGRAMPASGMTMTDAYSVLSRLSGVTIDTGESAQSTNARYKEARRVAHPDVNGGDRTAWNLLEQAADTLRRAGRLTA